MEYYNENEGRGLGIAGLVLGIIGIITSCIPVFGLFLGLVGLVLSIVGLSKANKVNAKKQLIIAGLLVSIFAAILGSGFLILYYQKYGDNFFEQLDDYKNDDGIFYNQNDEFDEMDNNFDSLKLDEDDIDNLDKSMEDPKNGPGSAPLE
jgi:hypothetical protein